MKSLVVVEVSALSPSEYQAVGMFSGLTSPHPALLVGQNNNLTLNTNISLSKLKRKYFSLNT